MFFTKLICLLLGHRKPPLYDPKLSMLRIQYTVGSKIYVMVYNPCERCGVYIKHFIEKSPLVLKESTGAITTGTSRESTPPGTIIH